LIWFKIFWIVSNFFSALGICGSCKFDLIHFESYHVWIESKCLDSYHLFSLVSIVVWVALIRFKYCLNRINLHSFRFVYFYMSKSNQITLIRITTLFLPKMLHLPFISIYSYTHTSPKLLNQLQLSNISLHLFSKNSLRILEYETSLDSKIWKLSIYKTKTITSPISIVLHLHFTFSNGKESST